MNYAIVLYPVDLLIISLFLHIDALLVRHLTQWELQALRHSLHLISLPLIMSLAFSAITITSVFVMNRQLHDFAANCFK